MSLLFGEVMRIVILFTAVSYTLGYNLLES